MLSSSTAVLILLCVVIALIVLLFIAVMLLLRRNDHVQKLTYPVYDYVVKKAEHEADALLKNARTEADSVVDEAQKEGTRIISSYTKKAEEAHRDFAHSFDELAASLQGILAEAKDAGNRELGGLFERAKELLAAHERSWNAQAEEITGDLGKAAQQLQKKSADTLQMIDTQLSKVQQEMQTSLRARMESQDRAIGEHLKHAMAQAEAEIESYKKARLSVLDAHIERLVEDVVRTVLHTELTGTQHGVIAREALGEAKRHNIL